MIDLVSIWFLGASILGGVIPLIHFALTGDMLSVIAFWYGDDEVDLWRGYHGKNN